MRADDELIAGAKTGDTSAWRSLYDAHAARLVLWLRTLPSGDAATSAEDLAAEAWMTAAEKIAGFTGSHDEFGGWLFGIARNLAANARRRSVRRATSPVTFEPGDPEPPALPSEAPVEALDWVRSVLSCLPRREREAVVCIDVVGLDVATTAQALGLSAAAVRVARHRGLARLRRAGVLGRAG